MLKAAVAPAETGCYEGTGYCNADARLPGYLDGGGAVEGSHEGGCERQEDEVADHEGRAAEEYAGYDFETPGYEEKRTPPQGQEYCNPTMSGWRVISRARGSPVRSALGLAILFFSDSSWGCCLGRSYLEQRVVIGGLRQTTALIISMSFSLKRLCRRAWMSTEDSPSAISSAVTLPAIGPMPMPRPLNPVQK